jgi:hypothetical protein
VRLDRSCFLATACITAALATGCGSSDEPPLTPAQFKAKANAICRASQKKAVPFPGKRSGKGLVTTARLITPYLKKTLKLARDSLEQLQELKPPKAQEQAVSELVTAQQARIVDLEQALDAAQRRDTRGFTIAFQNDQKHDGPRYLRAASKLGLTDCARSL